MRKKMRIAMSSTAVTLALMGGFALGSSPVAAAAGPKPMHISASGGDKTTIDRDGTEGDFTDAVQGKVDSDGDQDAFDLKKSEEATPQEKAPHKMTK